jgi:plastocyanin
MTPTTSARRRAPYLLALAALATFAIADAAYSQTGAKAAASVTIKDFDFSPMAVTVPVGGSVTWKNLDGEPHTVTSVDGLFRSGALDQGDSYSFKFTKAGVYHYLCSIHPRMMASVMVR